MKILYEKGFAHVSNSTLKAFCCVGFDITELKTKATEEPKHSNHREMCALCEFGSNSTKFSKRCDECKIYICPDHNNKKNICTECIECEKIWTNRVYLIKIIFNHKMSMN